jgi:EGF domain/RTX calcium-binding nonapeptide repeat (4 copies)
MVERRWGNVVRAASVVLFIATGLAGCEAADVGEPELGREQAAVVDTSVCPPGSNIIIGTPGNDTLTGGNGNDCILGDDGDDVLIGGNGNDLLIGGAGNDLIFAGNGADVAQGGPGNDVLIGDNGADRLSGDEGDDFIDSGNGNDTVNGGPGTDTCAGTSCESGEQPAPTCTSDASCAAGTRCVSGLCVACVANSECNDGNVCTFEQCQPVLGCSNPPVANGTLCLDSTVCNGSETCQNGTCTAGPPLVCDDGAFCTGVESCNAVTGCVAGTPPATDDGVFCTVDSCNEAGDRVDHIPDDSRCAPGFRCSAGGCVDIDECAENRDNCDANATCSNTAGGFTCTCNTGFEGNGVTCVEFCTPITVGAGVQRCVRIRGGAVGLHLSPSDPIPWEQQYVQSNEPEENFCGPTAGKNLFFWYGADVPYGTIADEMRTNEWDFPAVFAAVILIVPEPITAAILAAIISDAAVKAGTLTGDMENVIGNRGAPFGYVLCSHQDSSVSLDELRTSLSAGHPVVYLESRGEGNLHWAAVTGIADSGADPQLRIANSGERSFSQWQNDISLSQVGGGVVRTVLRTLFGLHPNTIIRLTPVGFACP